ncbi:antitoxin PrlF [Pseudomonas arsenicoxydans]|uniref:Antitoxin PrlF n=1 Tax=Pseudomonas arsenicoxydans TaxID=702115 RepID=A0A1H0NY35_9PSED|nr:type II toxin-antitoxin system PrlF family antitoxin [Pseudomonas arsenicoxydans]SDO97571.1 antitoxin PrlF [Pseudomonas arsenicoxydans]
MNDPRIPNITADNRVQSNTAEPMEAHHSVSRTLELLAADMNAYPERMLPVDTHLFDRITSLVGHVDVDLNSPLSAEDE